MKRTREQIKAELMKKAEEEIERLLSWEEKSCYGPNCLEVEGRNKWLAGDIQNGLRQCWRSPW